MAVARQVAAAFLCRRRAARRADRDRRHRHIDISATSTDMLALNHRYAERNALLNDTGCLQTGEHT
jgi:hypothetical protein